MIEMSTAEHKKPQHSPKWGALGLKYPSAQPQVGTQTERRGQDGPPAYATLTRRTTYSPAARRTKRVSEGRPCSQGESTELGLAWRATSGRLRRGAQGGREGPRHRAHGVGVSLCIRPDGGTSPPERRARTGENFGVFKAPRAN